jgi:trk system potassium uptake protein
MVGGRVGAGAPLTRGTLSELRLRTAEWGWVVTALVRDGKTTVAHGDTRLRAGDHALLMTTLDHVEDVGGLIGIRKRRLTRAIVVGATRFASLTAERLRLARIEVVIVESEPERAAELASQHPSVMVVRGDPTDPDVMAELDIGKNDVVISLTGWDEVNVLACLVAKAMGAGMVIARFQRTSYVKLLSGVGLDAAISSRLTAASEILRYVRGGHVGQVATFSDTDAEAIDIEVVEAAPAVGRTIANLQLPKGVVIGGISRNDTTFVPDGSSVIRAGDHIVFFALPEDINTSKALFANEQS